MQWIGDKNSGVSHFGVHPNSLPCDSLCFDVLHLQCAVTTRLMNNLRKFMMIQSVELIIDFSENILGSFFSDYNVLVRNLNTSFASYVGTELLDFIRNVDKIVAFLRKTFHTSPTLACLCDGLELFAKITPFLVISVIEDKEEYKRKILAFKSNLKLFYEVGRNTFLTKNSHSPGDDETFYLHCLRFYLPEKAKTTFEKHNLGLGIFTIQEFERRNKESKNAFKRFSNGKHNVVVSNLKRLWDVFFSRHNKI